MRTTAKPKKNFPTTHVQKFRERLKDCNASAAILADFNERVVINDRLPENIQNPVEYFFEETCRKFNFTAPFETDGRPRTFRARLLDEGHPDYRKDVGGNFIISSNNSPGEEQCYRRGFAQGFSDARQMVEDKRNLAAIKNREIQISDWRTCSIQIIGTLPGGVDPIDYGIRISLRVAISPKLRWKILQRDGRKCKACGGSSEDGKTLEVDHILAVAKGGTSEEVNLQTLCWECNRGKSDQ